MNVWPRLLAILFVIPRKVEWGMPSSRAFELWYSTILRSLLAYGFCLSSWLKSRPLSGTETSASLASILARDLGHDLVVMRLCRQLAGFFFPTYLPVKLLEGYVCYNQSVGRLQGGQVDLHPFWRHSLKGISPLPDRAACIIFLSLGKILYGSSSVLKFNCYQFPVLSQCVKLRSDPLQAVFKSAYWQKKSCKRSAQAASFPDCTIY